MSSKLSISLCEVFPPEKDLDIWHDHCQLAWRVCTDDESAIPIPFARKIDAEMAMRAIKDFEFDDDETYQKNRERMRRTMIEALAW